jgi:alpha-ketoglutarate-dependent taurine dioxygenase
VLGLTVSSIEGMEAEEGRALLDRMQDWATQPKFVYRHGWTIGDFLIWDNTGVMHRVEKYPADSGRLLSRITLAGEEPLA